MFAIYSVSDIYIYIIKRLSDYDHRLETLCPHGPKAGYCQLCNVINNNYGLQPDIYLEMISTDFDTFLFTIFLTKHVLPVSIVS